MKKKIIKILFLFSLFIFFCTGFAFNTNLQIDTNKATVDDRVNLKLTIDSKNWWSIQINEIKWIENFDIVSKSQSSNFSSINGEITSTLSINFTLIPKKKGSYEIGPIIMTDGKEKFESNIVKIDITGEKIFLNWNQSKNNIGTQNNPLQNPPKEINKGELDTIEQKNNSQLFLLLGVISSLILIVYFSLKTTQKQEPKEQQEEKIYIDQKQEYIYPEWTDENFAFKVDEIFREKISLKYNINLKAKNYSEIVSLIRDIETRDEIKELIELLQKLKYSHLITNNSRIIELLQHI